MTRRWRPSLGLLVLLAAIVLVEGVLTVGWLALRAAPLPATACEHDLQKRSDKWCLTEYDSIVDGRLPNDADFTAAVGTDAYSWTLGTSYYAKIINKKAFTIYAACSGSGQLSIKVYANGVDRHDWSIGCAGPPQLGYAVPADPTYSGPYVITALPVGHVTAAEYFIR